MNGEDLARAARKLVGVPFRLHGRDPRAGLDCVGVLAAAWRACGIAAELPDRYALRTRRLPDLAAIAAALGLCEVFGELQAGDVLVLKPAPVQHHFAIVSGRNLAVHAHAGLRRVVEGPLPAEWPILSRWRHQSREM